MFIHSNHTRNLLIARNNPSLLSGTEGIKIFPFKKILSEVSTVYEKK